MKGKAEKGGQTVILEPIDPPRPRVRTQLIYTSVNRVLKMVS